MTHYTYPITIEKEGKRYYAYSDSPGAYGLGSSSEQAKVSILEAIAFTFCSARRVDARFPLPPIPGRFPSPSIKCQLLENRSVFHAIRATRKSAKPDPI